MKLSKKDRRIIRNCIDEAMYKLGYLEHHMYISDKIAEHLDEVFALLIRIGARMEGKHGKRGYDRGVQETRRKR